MSLSSMKDGAQDYLMKGNLTRLVPAVQRELREAGERRAHKLL
jgi:FixJ family two-component response regulator